MPNLGVIRNSHLRSLIFASDAIMSQTEDEIQAMVDAIAMMSTKGQKELIELLETEQYEAQKQQREMQEADDKMDSIQMDIESTARAYQRENEEQESAAGAEDILKKI